MLILLENNKSAASMMRSLPQPTKRRCDIWLYGGYIFDSDPLAMAKLWTEFHHCNDKDFFISTQMPCHDDFYGILLTVYQENQKFVNE